MDEVLESVQGFTGLSGKRDDDFYDRLNNRVSVFIILVMAAITTLYQLGGSPIYCLAPVHFTESHEKYANSYCWVHNTYYIPFDEEIPRQDEPRQTILYYQWVPFILIIQSFMYFAPSLVWHGLNQKGGMDADSILNSSSKLAHASYEEVRSEILQNIVNQLDRFLQTRVMHGGGSGMQYRPKKALMSSWHCFGRRFGSYLCLLFMVTKLLYIGNSVWQFFLLNQFLFRDFGTYGFSLFGNLAANHNWENAPLDAFPRVTLCDFDVRRLGNTHRYTLQCALPLNLWNEKIFMTLWFWMVFVAGANIFGFITWLFAFLFPRDRLTFIRNHLRHLERIKGHKDEELSEKFTYDYLKQDGVFLLRLIAHNTNAISTSEITCHLWDVWISKPKMKTLLSLDAYVDHDAESEKEL